MYASVLFVLAAQLLFVAVMGRDDFVRTASGRSIPLQVLRTSLQDDNLRRVPERLFEIREARYLHGVDRFIDLHQLCPEIRQAPIFPSLSVNVNGRMDVSQGHGYLRLGGGFTLSHMPDGEVLSMRGPAFLLEPLDHVKYPGIFINKLDHNAVNSKQSNSVYDTIQTSFRSLWDLSFHKHADSVLLPVSVDSATFRMENAPCDEQSTPRFLDIAVVLDKSIFSSTFSNDLTRAQIATVNLVESASSLFAKKTCVRLRVTHFEAICESDKTDPYITLRDLKTSKVLDGFREIWQVDRKTIRRDLAVLLTEGDTSSTRLRGVSFLGVICNLDFSYAWTEGMSPFMLAHVVGHSLGAQHSLSGVMKAVLKEGENDLVFKKESQKEMISYIDSEAFECMSTSSPPIISTRPPSIGRTSKPSPTITTTSDKTRRPRNTKSTKTLSPTTTKAPENQSCASGLSKNLRMKCMDKTYSGKQRKYKIIMALRTKPGGIKLRLAMLSKDKEATSKKNHGLRFRIMEYGTSISMRNFNPVKRMPTLVAGGARVANENYGLAEIDSPDSADSCCGRNMFVSASVLVNVTKLTRDGNMVGSPYIGTWNRKARFEFQCLSCTTAMPSQKCPKCTTPKN